MLEKIIEDLDINLTQLKMTEAERVETTQKINIVKNIINRFNSTTKKKKNIEKQLQIHEWIIKLIEDQLQKDKTYYTFGENFENCNLHKKDKLNSNVTLQKRKSYPLTSEERLKDLPSIVTQIPTGRVKRIEVAK